MTKPRSILSIAAATLTASSLAAASPIVPLLPIRVTKPLIDKAGRPGCGNVMRKSDRDGCAHTVAVNTAPPASSSRR